MTSRSQEKEKHMWQQRRWLGLLMVVLMILGSGGWVFNPTNKPAGGFTWNRFTILTPENVPVPITISRELVYKGKSLGRVKAMNSNNTNGTYVQTLNFTIPADAERGVYTLVTRVSTGFGMGEKSIEFLVN
jgi:hypothetical protein